MSLHDDTHWMRLALAQAQAAARLGEVPVGAVVVKDERLIASGHNAPVSGADPTAHAEVMALREAAKALGNYRLDGCTLYVTLEPCAMCSGAMLHARLARVVYGATEPKTGAAGSVTNLFANPQLNHQTQVSSGVLADDCAQVLQAFFQERREQGKATRQAAHPLRDDALRTPDERFHALPDWPWPPQYLSDLPALNGLRLHYIDVGDAASPQVTVCLHGLQNWSYAWREAIAQRSQTGRVLALDLPGFGRSDKPKKEAAHSREWYVRCVMEWMQRLNLPSVTLLVPEGEPHIGRDLQTATPERILRIEAAPTAPLSDAALSAPFPDAGHKAALRAKL
jgi:tRNA(adenine34) deaminase